MRRACRRHWIWQPGTVIVVMRRERTRTMVMASWLLTTSHNPSVAMMRKVSLPVSSVSRMSGSATTYFLSRRSPNALDTAMRCRATRWPRWRRSQMVVNIAAVPILCTSLISQRNLYHAHDHRLQTSMMRFRLPKGPGRPK